MRAPKAGVPNVVKKDSVQFTAICRELLEKGFSVRFTAQGESMRPNILPNDQVVVAPAFASELKSGQVVLAQGREGLRVHRIVQRLAEGSAAITRGDAGQANDDAAQTVVGKVVAIERNGEEISTDRAWTAQIHTVRTWLHKLRLAGRRRLTRNLLGFVPLAVLMHLFGLPAPATAQNVTLSQTTSSATPNAGTTYTLTDKLVNNSIFTAVNTPTITQTIPTGTTLSSYTATGFTCTPTATALTCVDGSNLQRRKQCQHHGHVDGHK